MARALQHSLVLTEREVRVRLDRLTEFVLLFRERERSNAEQARRLDLRAALIGSLDRSRMQPVADAAAPALD
jgi:hypothetical protein